MIGRRAFLTRIGIGAVAAPAAAKHVMENAAAKLAGVDLSAVGLIGGQTGIGAPSTAPFNPPFARSTAIKRLLQTALRDEYTSVVFEQHRRVLIIDIDLASKRSFSLAAKITYQRQRNVEREIAHEALDDSETAWGRAHAMLKKAMGLGF